MQQLERRALLDQKTTKIPSAFAIQTADIHTQVDRIITSPELEHSPRLQELLKYIVNEFLAGRVDRIKGFTIGAAIYGSGDRFDSESNSIVRVEVGRLRRRLTEYYLTSGHDDPIVVDIPKGSYVPRFTLNPQTPEEQSPPVLFPFNVGIQNRWLIVGVLGLAILLALNWRYYDVLEHSITGETNPDKAQEHLQESEAQILFQQAFILLMSPADGARLTTSQELFQRTIEIDSNFAGGYAGKSVTLSFGVIFAHSENPSDDLRRALVLAKSAADLGPEYPLGYAALALAQSLNTETDSALVNVRRVLALHPHQAKANAITAVALITSGEPSRAIDLLNEALGLNRDESRTPILNLLGIAQYLNGNFSGAAESIELNLARNGPTGSHMDVFLAAAYAQMAKDFEAQAIIEKLQRTNPDYPVERWLSNFIKSEDELGAIMSKLQLLGLPWS
jgi:Tfp pilus assembly protein PilF